MIAVEAFDAPFHAEAQNAQPAEVARHGVGHFARRSAFENGAGDAITTRIIVEAVRPVADLGDPAREAVLKLAKNKNPRVKSDALRALGFMPPAEASRTVLLAALDRLRSAIDRLREFQESMNQDTSISPLTLEQRFADAQAHYQDILAQAQAGNVDAIEALPDVAQQYLELAAQLYGTAGAGYGEIFQSVYDAVGAIVDNFDAEADRWQHLLDGQHDTNHILQQSLNQQHQTNDLLRHLLDAPGGGGTWSPPPGEPGGGTPGGGSIGEQMARVLQFPSGLQIIAQAGTSPPHAGGPPPPEPFPGIPSKKQRNPDFAIPGWGVGHLPSPTANRDVVVAIEKMHSGMKDELQDLRAENEALRKELAGLRRDQRSATTATRDAITKGATGGGGGLVRLPMPSSSNRRSA